MEHPCSPLTQRHHGISFGLRQFPCSKAIPRGSASRCGDSTPNQLGSSRATRDVNLTHKRTQRQPVAGCLEKLRRDSDAGLMSPWPRATRLSCSIQQCRIICSCSRRLMATSSFLLLWRPVQSPGRLLSTAAVYLGIPSQWLNALNAVLEGISREPLVVPTQLETGKANGMGTARMKPKTRCFPRRRFVSSLDGLGYVSGPGERSIENSSSYCNYPA